VCVYIRYMHSFLYASIGNFLIILFAAGCGSHQSQKCFNFANLTGSWSSVNQDASQIEEWEEISDSVFVGRGFIMEQGDTTFFESLEIRKVSGTWTYFAKVNQINGAEVVPFTLTRQSNNRVEFSNPTHDFPKKIGYELVSEDELQAYIEGPRDGQTIRILFDFKRNF
jgi:hypothetical protein